MPAIAGEAAAQRDPRRAAHLREAVRGHWPLLAVLALTAVTYLPTLTHWFLSDDFWLLRAAHEIGWPRWFRQSWDYREPGPVAEFGEYRPLYLLIFKAEFTLFGLHAFWYRAVNLALHLLVTVLVWRVLLRLSGRKTLTALATAIFALHPAYQSVVDWVANGNTSIAAALALMAFLVFLDLPDTARRGRRKLALSVLLYGAAILVHPAALPLTAAMALAFFLRPEGRVLLFRPRSWLPFLPYVAVSLPFLAVQSWVGDHYGRASAFVALGRHVPENYRDYLGFSLYPFPDHASGVRIAAAAMVIVIAATCLSARSRLLMAPAAGWYVAALAPSAALSFGTAPRLLYMAGPPLALLLALAVVSAMEAIQRRLALPGPSWLILAAGFAAAVPAVLAAHVTVARTWLPPPDRTIGAQTAANRELVGQLRRDVPSLEPGAILYVAGAPSNLTVFSDEALDNLVRLYYGRVHAVSVPLREPPFWNETDIRQNLRPEDRLFELERR